MAFEYGTPFFIEANLPIETAKHISPFRRLMIAQDTGSAIVGPARADLYWGAGDKAALIAGRIRHSGRFVMLLPRELDMMEAGSQIPLPTPKPKIPEVEVHKLDKWQKRQRETPQLLRNRPKDLARFRSGSVLSSEGRVGQIQPADYADAGLNRPGGPGPESRRADTFRLCYPGPQLPAGGIR